MRVRDLDTGGWKDIPDDSAVGMRLNPGTPELSAGPLPSMWAQTPRKVHEHDFSPAEPIMPEHTPQRVSGRLSPVTAPPRIVLSPGTAFALWFILVMFMSLCSWGITAGLIAASTP